MGADADCGSDLLSKPPTLPLIVHGSTFISILMNLLSVQTIKWILARQYGSHALACTGGPYSPRVA
jgi:hypothetical protein